MSTISASTTSTTGFKVTSDTTGTLVLQTGSTPTTAVTIDTSQNVGIGTASPGKKLDVNGEARIVTGLTISPNTSSLYTVDGALSYYASGNAVYLNGTDSGWLALQASGQQKTTIQLFGNAYGSLPNTITFTTNSSERARIDSSGNLGLRVTPSAWHSTTPAFQIGAFGLLTASTSSNYCNLGTNYYFNGSNNVYIGTGRSTLYSQNDGAHSWLTAASGTAGNTVSFTTAMTLDLTGVLCLGSTSNTWAVAGALKTVGITSHAGQSGAYQNNGINLEWRSGALRIWVDTTDLGTVQFASDYRIKKDIATQTLPALDRIAQLRPVTFEFGDYGDLFKGDNVAREGFIAHEVAEVIPSAVDGEKDCENQIQSLRLDALCSVMVKAIQEQQAIIETLTNRITALEAK